MIFSARVSQVGSLHVANLLLLKDFTPPLHERAKIIFRAFDEAYLKVRSDLDATKIYSEDDLKDQRLMEINTATQATLRGIQRGSKITGEIYTLAHDRVPGADKNSETRRFWCNLPVWAYCFVETQDGSLYRIETRNAAGDSDSRLGNRWRRWDSLPEDRFVHVNAFDESCDLRKFTLSREGQAFYAGRLGNSIPSKDGGPRTLPLLSLKLGSQEW